MPETLLPQNGGSATVPTPAGGTAAPATEAAAPAAAQKPSEAGTQAPAANEDPLSVDIKAAVEKARKQEKDKLYSQIQAKEAEIAAKEKLISEQSAALAALASKKADAEKPAGEAKETPAANAGLSQAQLDAALAAAVGRVEEVFTKKLSDLEQQNSSLQKALEMKELDTFKMQLISDNKDSIIPELIQGNSKDELEQSLVISKQAFARIAKAMSDKGASLKEGADGQIPPTPPISGGQQAAPGSQPSVRSMSTQDYAKNRERLLAEARQAALTAIKGLQD